jgi:hypothetical protein
MWAITEWRVKVHICHSLPDEWQAGESCFWDEVFFATLLINRYEIPHSLRFCSE